jgi:hypothetical protein
VTLVFNILVGLLLAVAMAGVVHLWRMQEAAARREALAAMAARRGWAVTATGGRLGRAGALRIAPRGGLPWILEVGPGAEGGLSTEYRASEPRWAEGIFVAVPLGAARPAGLGDAASAPGRARAAIRLLGPEAGALASLPPVEAPEGLVLLSDGSPGRRVILSDLARALNAWRPLAKGETGLPVLVLSPEGMRLRLRHGLSRADHVERFIDLALDLSRVIGPSS